MLKEKLDKWFLKFLDNCDKKLSNKIFEESRKQNLIKKFIKENFLNSHLLSDVHHKMLEIDATNLREVLIKKDKSIVIKFEQEKTGDRFSGDAQFLCQFHGFGSFECLNCDYVIKDLRKVKDLMIYDKIDNRIILDISYEHQNIRIECDSVKIIDFIPTPEPIEYVLTHDTGEIPDDLAIVIE